VNTHFSPRNSFCRFSCFLIRIARDTNGAPVQEPQGVGIVYVPVSRVAHANRQST
jgi:hypothetical protein